MQVTRVSELVTFILMAVWIAKLGGLSLSPKQLSATTNDTGQLFNWHPLLVRCCLSHMYSLDWALKSLDYLIQLQCNPLHHLQSPALVMDHAIACRWPSLSQSSWLRLSCPTAPR